MKHLRTIALGLLALVNSALPAALPIASTGCGGCEASTASALQISPASACLDLADDPEVELCGANLTLHLTGTNGCADALMIQESDAAPGEAVEIPAGAAIDVDIEQHLDNQGDGDISMLLGGQTITAHFHVQRGT